MHNCEFRHKFTIYVRPARTAKARMKTLTSPTFVNPPCESAPAGVGRADSIHRCNARITQLSPFKTSRKQKTRPMPK